MISLVGADLFATKGAEYLLVLGFLLALLLFWRLLLGPAAPQREPAGAAAGARRRREWFRLAPRAHYHPGHTWAAPERGGLVRVGVDDFAQKLVGRLATVRLPSPGERLEQGEVAWSLGAGGRSVDMLSPVTGEVVSVNRDAAFRPDLVNEDPYGDGWLVEVRPANWNAARRTLLSGPVARAWLRDATRRLLAMASGPVGPALQDGGVPIEGMARALSPARWHEIAAGFFRTDGDGHELPE